MAARTVGIDTWIINSEVQGTLDALSSSAQREGAKKAWWQWRDEAEAAPTREEQERVMKEGVEALPSDPWMLDVYARFLGRDPTRRDEAERLHLAALARLPQDNALRGNYANLLARIPGREDDANNEFHEALSADQDVRRLTNFAGFLLAVGRADGGRWLERARRELSLSPPRALMLESEFYAYAHAPRTERSRALGSLRSLLVSFGLRSKHWDFTRNIERARADGHPEAEWLQKLADVINDKAELASLDAWPAWREISATDSA